MSAKMRILIACLAASVLVLAASLPPADARDDRQIYSEDDGLPLDLLGASLADTTEIYFEDFSDGESGWTGKDLWVQDAYWHQAFYDAGSGPAGVMWCGLENPVGWATPPGYGNNWRQSLVKSFTIPAGGTIDYSVQFDTEEPYDFLCLQVSVDGGSTYDSLAAYTGNSSGFQTQSTDLSAYAGQTVLLRFFFKSDVSFSDEDGSWDTDGGARLDWVQVTGYPVDDFESDNCGWTALGLDPYPIQFRLVETPACEDTLPCDGYSWTWVAYDPATGVFPFFGDTDYLGSPLVIQSPVIDIPANMTQYLLQFDVYSNLPRTNLVFFMWEVAAEGQSWRTDNFVYDGGTQPQGFITKTIDLTGYIPAGTTQITVRLEAVAYDELDPFGFGWSGTHTSAPMFDNVRILGGMDPDLDRDGVPVPTDACPTVNASFFDSDGNGCLDASPGGRHVEYWDRGAFPLTYVINEGGCPTVGDGSEFTAIEQSMNVWCRDPNQAASVSYGGTTPQNDAEAMDLVNLITFNDPDYRFGVGVIAVGLTTSFTEPTEMGGIQYRPGQIIDSDMIFNPGKSFRTATSGPSDATYIEAVATHEAGHLFGISHSPVQSSTMYFVLPPGLEAASLEPDDSLAMHKAYWTTLEGTLSGRVIDGYTGQRIAGAAVFAVDAASGDTVASEYTLPGTINGATIAYSFSFRSLPAGNYYVAVHPLDGTSAIGYMEPAYVNDLIAGCAQTNFIPEWYNTGESSTDDPNARTAIPMTATTNRTISIITNIDATPPTVLAAVPEAGETGISVGTSVLVSFSEAINDATIQGNFRLRNTATGQVIPGNASVLNDGTLIAFVPSTGLDFSTTYRLELETGLQDKFQNGLAAPYQTEFTTEVEPDVALASLLPSKGPAGILVSLNGKGFDPVAGNNTVSFGGAVAAIQQASPSQLVVSVPDGATSGIVHVYNQTQGRMSNDLQFTVLSPDEVPKGFDFAVTPLSATPRAIAVLPNGSYAYMATDAGAQAVVVDPALSGYMTAVAVPIAGGLTDVACSPAGNRVYGVGASAQKLYRMDATPSSIGLLSETALGACPRGIFVHPKGHRAYVPTDEGEIGIWDIDEASSTFEWKVGTIIPPDPNVRGSLATDPAGNILLALSGTGRMFVFDLATNELLANVKVGPDPRDVAVDRVGQFAYVADGTGIVSVVSLANYAWQQDIRVGGSLRGIAVTPAGTFAYAVNREMNLLEAIDLRRTSQAYRAVATRITLPINPIDIDLSPDGDYAFTVSEAELRLVATSVGLGPELATVSRVAGPVGTKVVLAGSDFLEGTTTTVDFGGVTATPERYADDMLVVTVPSAATSGKAAVVTSSPGEAPLKSNAIYFDVLPATVRDALRLAATLPGKATPAADGGSVLQVSPAGDFIAIADKSGGFHILASDPASPTYHQYAGSVSLGSVAQDIAINRKGDRAFVILPAAAKVQVVGTDRLAADFLSPFAAVDFSGIPGSSIARAAVSPDGSVMLVSDPGKSQVYFVDIEAGSPAEYQILASVSLASGAGNGIVREMAFHPGGAYAYLAMEDSDPAAVLVLDTSPTSPSYRTVVSSVTLPGSVPMEIPISLAFTPWGSRCLVLTSQSVGTPNRTVVMLNTANPASPSVAATLPLGGTAAPVAEQIAISPRGDRAIAGVRGAGLFNIRIQTAPDALTLVEQVGSPADYASTAGLDYAPDASKFYSLAEATDNLFVYDFSTVQTIAASSGNAQTGVINQLLPAALRARVSDAGGGSVEGIPVTFAVTSGGGRFAGTGTASQVVSTTADGIAEARWVLGPSMGTGAQTVRASATGLGGSPLTFSASGVADPATLPLTVASVIPPDGTTNVSVSTVTQVAFSRPVDPASVDASTFFMHTGNFTPVPAVIGFADENRRVSLSPRNGLEASTTYRIEVTSAIMDADGGALAQPVSSTFTTEAPPPVVLYSIAPISGTENVTVVLSGSGFDEEPALNKVLFGSLEADMISGGKDYLVATVPIHAATGSVRVVNTVAADTSNALDFTVLTPDAIPINNVITSVSTGSGTHSVSITPDGTLAYAVSPFGNRVVVISLKKIAVVTSIPVGENPVAIAIDPQGKFAYVANYLDGTISVVDVDSGSPTFNQVVTALRVGGGPSDLAVTPDGDGLIVANPAWGEINFVDTDPTSETYRAVIAGVRTGEGSTTVAITPDGGYIYVGTSFGFIVVSASDRTVISSISTGTGTNTVAITPDGALLVLLTTEGRVDIYDIRPGSARENQVISSIQTGSGTVNVAISPDGGFLYLVQGVGDRIFVVALDLSNVVGVREAASELPPLNVEWTVVDTLAAGEDPCDVAFDPTGSGNFIITNAGDYTVTLFGTAPPPQGPGTLAGRVTANCPAPGTGLMGVEVDVFRAGTGELGASVQTAAEGYFSADLPAGEYTVTVVTPLGYIIGGEEVLATIASEDTTAVGFALQCEYVVPDPRKMSYWKHQVAMALSKGKGQYEVDGPTLCSYLDLIQAHFNSNLLNPVVVYDPPASGQCTDKLAVVKDVLNLQGSTEMVAQARQELMALLFNVSAQKIHLAGMVSSDSATVSMAITYVDHLIDDGIAENDTLAREIGKKINDGKAVEPGVIPSDTPNIIYIIRAKDFGVSQNGPNPFSSVTSIEFAVPEAAQVKIAIYDVSGRLVRTLVDGRVKPDVYKASWDGTDSFGSPVASGIYFYRFDAGEFSATKKMILVR